MRIDLDFIRQSFSAPAAVRYYADAVAEVGLWRSEKIIYSKYFHPNERLLDIGCGAGRTTIGLYQLGFRRVEGIDLSPAMIERARAIAGELGLDITFGIGDARRMAYADCSFAGAFFSFNGLMQIPGAANRLAAAREIRRVLRPGGCFIFTAPDRGRDYDKFWRGQQRLWKEGKQNPRLHEYGDVIFHDGRREVFLHYPAVEEVADLLDRAGLRLIECKTRKSICVETERIDNFAGDCLFWIARR